MYDKFWQISEQRHKSDPQKPLLQLIQVKISETFNPFGNDYIMYSNICTVYLENENEAWFHLS